MKGRRGYYDMKRLPHMPPVSYIDELPNSHGWILTSKPKQGKHGLIQILKT